MLPVFSSPRPQGDTADGDVFMYKSYSGNSPDDNPRKNDNKGDESRCPAHSPGLSCYRKRARDVSNLPFSQGNKHPNGILDKRHLFTGSEIYDYSRLINRAL